MTHSKAELKSSGDETNKYPYFLFYRLLKVNSSGYITGMSHSTVTSWMLSGDDISLLQFSFLHTLKSTAMTRTVN
jgi:hypothetical protein